MAKDDVDILCGDFRFKKEVEEVFCYFLQKIQNVIGQF